jgi:hypothetical protein
MSLNPSSQSLAWKMITSRITLERDGVSSGETDSGMEGVRE